MYPRAALSFDVCAFQTLIIRSGSPFCHVTILGLWATPTLVEYNVDIQRTYSRPYSSLLRLGLNARNKIEIAINPRTRPTKAITANDSPQIEEKAKIYRATPETRLLIIDSNPRLVLGRNINIRDPASAPARVL
jgi:hypothetical protein